MPNNPIKMVPRWDALFAEISQKTGRPIVFREGIVPVATEVIKTRLSRAGVRATWLPMLDPADYLQLLALADLVLDPPAWSGGNTTLEAFRYRRPVLTLPGEFMRGRHGLAFLTQAHLGSLIADTPEDYVKIASTPGIWEASSANADWDGPFEDKRVPLALDDWIRHVSRD
jgi:predicted O-linked N-acetylglucosamine transferase (SPINDLY family)